LFPGRAIFLFLVATATLMLCVPPPSSYSIGTAGGALTRSNNPPNAVITTPVDGNNYPDSNPIRFDATASNDPDGDALDFTWTLMMFPPQPGPNMFPKIKNVAAFSESLDVGTWMVTLDVNDSIESDSQMIMINVIKNDAPSSVIASPTDGEVYTTDEDILFDAAGSNDPNGDVLSYHWESSRDGNLTDLESFTSTLSEGAHTIKLVVKDIYETESVTEIDITVRIPNYPPNIFITTPDSSNPRSGDEFEIKWTASDANVNDMITIDLYFNDMKDVSSNRPIASDLPNVGSYVWDVSEMEVGDYYVHGVVTDGEGLTGTSWSTGYVRVYRNYPPAAVEAVEVMDSHELSPTLTWDECTDPNGDAVSYLITIGRTMDGNEIADSALSNNNRYRVTKTLEYNRTYYVRMTTLDSWGLTSDVFESTFELANSPPTTPEIVIEPAVPTSKNPLRSTITTGALDPDGDEVTYHYRWLTKTPGGFFEEVEELTGNEVPSTRLKAGDVWKCELWASDGYSLSGTASISMTIRNLSPIAVIASPSAPDGVYTCVSRNVELSAEGSHDEDGDELTYQWTSNIDGHLGDTESISAQLSTDINQITLTVGDGLDTDTAMITVIVKAGDVIIEGIEVNPASPEIGNKVIIYGVLRNVGGDEENVLVELMVDGEPRGKDIIELFPHTATLQTSRFEWIPQSAGKHVITLRTGDVLIEESMVVKRGQAADDGGGTGSDGADEKGEEDAVLTSFVKEMSWLWIIIMALLVIIVIFGLLIRREKNRKKRRRRKRAETAREERVEASRGPVAVSPYASMYGQPFVAAPMMQGFQTYLPPMPMFDNRIFEAARLLPQPPSGTPAVIDMSSPEHPAPPIRAIPDKGMGLFQGPMSSGRRIELDRAAMDAGLEAYPILAGSGAGKGPSGKPAAKEIVMVECYSCGGDIPTTSTERPLLVVCPHCGTEGELG